MKVKAGIGAVMVLAAGLLLAGCSMGNVVADVLPAAAGGLPDNAPARLDRPAAYPAVHDMPPKREEKTLTGVEQVRLEKALEAQRQQMTGETPPPAPAKAGTGAKAGSSAKAGAPLAITGTPSGTGGSRNP